MEHELTWAEHPTPNHYANDFETQAKGHPEIKTRLAVRMAALLRAIANEEP